MTPTALPKLFTDPRAYQVELARVEAFRDVARTTAGVFALPGLSLSLAMERFLDEHWPLPVLKPDPTAKGPSGQEYTVRPGPPTGASPLLIIQGAFWLPDVMPGLKARGLVFPTMDARTVGQLLFDFAHDLEVGP